MAKSTIFSASRNWPHYTGPQVQYNPNDGRFYTVQDGRYVPTQNPLTAGLPAAPQTQGKGKR